jgi:hypothetical protein
VSCHRQPSRRGWAAPSGRGEAWHGQQVMHCASRRAASRGVAGRRFPAAVSLCQRCNAGLTLPV